MVADPRLRLAWRMRGGTAARCVAIVILLARLPAAEELFFRGVAYGPLFRKFGVAGATVSSAALWAAGHYDGPSARGIVKMSM